MQAPNPYAASGDVVSFPVAPHLLLANPCAHNTCAATG
jgi:hypothetical protein